MGANFPARVHLATSADVLVVEAPGIAPGVSWAEARDAAKLPQRRPHDENDLLPNASRAKAKRP